MQKIALIGNPNTGKTTLYNALTKSQEHVGNWHGVTNQKIEKIIELNSQKISVVDLPGTYSLTPYSMEEKVTGEYIKNNRDTKYILVCDELNIKRNLYLVLQMLELNLQCVLILNLFKKNKNFKNIEKKLKKTLKIDVFSYNFKEKNNYLPFLNNIINKNNNDFKENNFDYLNVFPLKKINSILKKEDKMHYEFLSIRVIEGGLDYKNFTKLNDLDKQFLDGLYKENNSEKIAKLRYKFIDKILEENTSFLDKENIKKIDKKSLNKIDKIVLNKWLAFPIFLLVMFIVFYLTFSSVGKFLSQKLEWFLIDFLGGKVEVFLHSHCEIEWINSLVCDALIGGVGAILVFLPQVLLLFFFLTLFEESGYLSRIAYVFEGVFSKFGLSGKSVFTWLMGFGCSATAILTAQNLENKRDKIKTILVTPFIPCSAKLPVLAVLVGAFFGGNIGLIFLLYILACLVAMLIAFLFEKTILPHSNNSFILEFPRYQNPFNTNLLKSLYRNCGAFIKRVGGYLLGFSIVVWLLQSFDFSLHYLGTDKTNGSILQGVSQIIAPLFAPIGLDNWGIVSACLAGIVAKELIVSTIGIINSVSAGEDFDAMIGGSLLLSSSVIHLDIASCLSFITFIMLYVPCVATFSTMRAEIGIKWTLFSYAFMLITAYISSFIVYKTALIFINLGISEGILTISSIAFLVVTFIKLINRKNRKCEGCKYFSACKK